MRRREAVMGLAALVLSGCGTESEVRFDGTFSRVEWERVETLSPLPAVPPSPTNAVADDSAAAVLGQKLFFDPRFSGPIAEASDLGELGESGRVSCASCHDPDGFFSDTRSDPANVSLGIKFTPRNSPPIANVAFYRWFGWGGRWDSLWMQAPEAAELGAALAANRCAIAHTLFANYRDEYDRIFVDEPLHVALDPAHVDSGRFPLFCKPGAASGEWEAMADEDQSSINRAFANYGKAIEAYERLLVAREAPFDVYVAEVSTNGSSAAISAAAKRGLQLFVGKAGCVACHEGPFFTNREFHTTAVGQRGPNVPDEDQGRTADIAKLLASPFNGLGEFSDDTAAGGDLLRDLVSTPQDLGAFRTKSLRDVAETGPFMHAGQLATLEEVVDFYNVGGDDAGFVGTTDPRIVPLNLSRTEVLELVEFLSTLTGEQIPANLRADPFR